jgi:hypothetical protein
MLSRTRAEGCASDLALDRMLSGELEESPHVKACQACAARLGDLRAERAGVIPLGARRKKWIPAVAGLVAAAAAVVLFVRLGGEPRGVSAKGAGDALSMHVLRDGQPSPWLPGSPLRPGDKLRFSVNGHGERWIAVLARDGAGLASVYFPMGSTTQKVGLDGPTPLPGSVTLDAITGHEVVHAVICEAEVLIGPLQRALQANALVAPPGCTLASLQYDKVP